ncbi:unnamed protein product, partial [Ilex paraguariensis]
MEVVVVVVEICGITGGGTNLGLVVEICAFFMGFGFNFGGLIVGDVAVGGVRAILRESCIK